MPLTTAVNIYTKLTAIKVLVCGSICSATLNLLRALKLLALVLDTLIIHHMPRDTHDYSHVRDILRAKPYINRFNCSTY